MTIEPRVRHDWWVAALTVASILAPQTASAGTSSDSPGDLRRALPTVVPEPAAEALGALGWAPADLRFDAADMDLYGGGAHRIPLFDAWIDRPFLIPEDLAVFESAVLGAVSRPSELAVFAGLRIGRGVRRGLIADPADALEARLAAGDPATVALDAVWDAATRVFASESGSAAATVDRHAARRALDSLPPAWVRPVCLLLLSAADAAVWRAHALSPVEFPVEARVRPELFEASRGRAADPPPGHAIARDERRDAGSWLYAEGIRYVVGLDADTADPAFLRGFESAAASCDLALLQAGAADLLVAVRRAAAALDTAEAAPIQPIRFDTPLGAVRIGSSADDTHAAGDDLLLIDPWGDDRYGGGGASSPRAPVSLLLDLGGDDRYESADSTRPAFGAGVAGIGVLVDLAGDDRYAGVHLGQGAGLCGVGVLWDRAGDDAYEAVTTSQGAGLFGIGILDEEAGEDRYHTFQQSQGYGYVLGCGLLVDAAGNDLYVAENEEIRYPSAQSPEHNSSLAQGFGFGKRADFTDGSSLAGGLGLLVDGAGDDVYRCGVFGQGAGYWYGVGALADRSGNDTYEGVWYTQGAAAHFALGALCDRSGDDQYRSLRNMAMGAGHDFSLGLLYDRSGADSYVAPNLSLGGGNANGIGIFWDVAGDDRYEVEAATTLGRSNVASRGGLRDRMKNLGLFLDTGGRDAYPSGSEFAGNDRLWTQAGTDTTRPLAVEAGAGLDTEWTPPADR